MHPARVQEFYGQAFFREGVALTQEIVKTCGGVSRTELAHTMCELLDWKRPNGKLEGPECRDFLERLEDKGLQALPSKREARTCTAPSVPDGEADERPWADLSGSVDRFIPLELDPVETGDQRRLFRGLVGRYHYLGHKSPFGFFLFSLASHFYQ
jgi:hypothetical protein